MRTCGKEVLNEVALFLFTLSLAGGHSDNPLAAAALGTVRANVGAFDKAIVG